ncbi:MAG: GNAT family N-acetyltransferase [Pseudodesulfovibrio sp.]
MHLIEEVAGGTPYIVLAKDGDKLVGAIPFFLSRDGGCGPVINSLPFYGSVGGPILAPGPDSLPAMLEGLDEFAVKHHCSSSTIILSPFYEEAADFGLLWGASFEDNRIGQIVRLPADVSDVVAQCLKPRMRTYYRKGLAGGLHVHRRHDDEAVAWLEQMHQENMGRISGTIKPSSFFEACQKEARGSGFCEIWCVELDGQILAALLISRYDKSVDYLVPVVDHSVPEEVSALRPSVFLIASVMAEAVSTGAEIWSFGGTWVSQKGVYQFKSGFGAEDWPYLYFTKIYNGSILDQNSESLLEQYPYYYVVPFSALKG